MAARGRASLPTQCGITEVALTCAKDRQKPYISRRMPGAGLSQPMHGKVLSYMPPFWHIPIVIVLISPNSRPMASAIEYMHAQIGPCARAIIKRRTPALQKGQLRGREDQGTACNAGQVVPGARMLGVCHGLTITSTRTTLER